MDIPSSGSHTDCSVPNARRARALSRAVLLTGLLLALSALLAPSLGAQIVRGIVVDAETSAPIEGAGLWILDAAGKALGTGVVSSDSGLFAVQLSKPGMYRLRIARLGYAALTTDTLRLAAGEALSLRIALEQRAVELGAVQVTERTTLPGNGALAGFELRRLRGMGKFITRADIGQRAPLVFLDLISGVPGVRILVVSQGRHIVRMGRASPILRDMSRPLESNEVLGEDAGIVAENDCPVIFYLDGVRLNNSNDRSLDRVEVIYRLPVEAIEGVEIYRGASELPAEFGGSDARCGVVVVWTRRGR